LRGKGRSFIAASVRSDPEGAKTDASVDGANHAALTALSQPKRIGKPSPASSVSVS
jgi:hypothetical protein